MEWNGMEMPRYFSDLDNGKTKYVDTIGTELADEKMVPREALGLLVSVFKETLPDDNDRALVVSVRNEARIIFTTSLILRSDWMDTGYDGAATAIKRLVVLIVEDDVLSRMSAADMIGNAGYDVVEAGNADEAITILEARPDVQVVFTDIQMPGSMDGLKLARHVKRKWPPIKIIATSGQFAIRDDDLPKGGVFLPKPYTANTVTAALREFAVGMV